MSLTQEVGAQLAEIRVPANERSQGSSIQPQHSLFGRRQPDDDRVERSEIQAVILAAGRGNRLRSVIHAQPKCLAPVGGRTLIEHQLELLWLAGIHRVAVVTGYRAAQVRKALGTRVEYFHNKDWARTEGLHSISLCREWVTGPLVVLNCDVLADPELLSRLLHGPGNAFVFDSTSGADAEEMAVEFDDGYLAAMSKDLPVERTHGENVGILYLDKWAVRLLFDQAEAMLKSGESKARLPAALQRVARYIPFRGIDIADLSWIEVDFPDDLDVARHIIWPAICIRLGSAQPLAADSPQRAVQSNSPQLQTVAQQR